MENVLEVQHAFDGRNDSQGNTYLKFEDVTLVPYEPKLIDYNMLTLYQVSLLSILKNNAYLCIQNEIDIKLCLQRRWLNRYNTRIRELVGAELKNQMKMSGFYWMMNHTALIPEYGYINSGYSLFASKYLIFILSLCFILQINS